MPSWPRFEPSYALLRHCKSTLTLNPEVLELLPPTLELLVLASLIARSL